MARLEDLVSGAEVRGVDPAGPVTVVTAQWHGTQALTLVFRDVSSRVQERPLTQACEALDRSLGRAPATELQALELGL